jgi:deoxyguanosine kinase
MVISLEGLPGAGKTTAAPLVANRIGAETVIETTADHPFLQQVYDDGDRDDLTTELAFLLVHANPFRRIDRTRLAVCDFAPAKDLLFAEDMLEGDEFALFDTVYHHVYRDHPPPDVVVYLRAEPELCLERVQQRMLSDPSRAFERGITIERLQRMYDRYEVGYRHLGQRVVAFDVDPGLDRPAMADGVVAQLDLESPGLVR